MEHHFNIELAKLHGIEEAIIIHNLAFWIKKNIANNKNNYDGQFWVYNSVDAFKELFPYMTESKIYRCLKNLEENVIIKTGNYNKMKFDRTKWYCIIDIEVIDLYDLKNPFCNMKNGTSQNERTIPDNKPDSKPNKEIYSAEKIPAQYTSFSEKFHVARFKRLGKLYPQSKKGVTEKQILSGAKVIDELIRIDGYDLNEIQEALRFAVKDNFWNKQVRTLSGLRKRKNDLTKFDNLYAAFKESENE